MYQLNVPKSIGPDGIQTRILKELVDVVAEPLSIIYHYQRSWESVEILDDWKLASIIPIYKKGMKGDPRNYRLVSLISLPGRIMDIIPATTEKHLKNNAVTRHRQHGTQRESPA